VAPIGGQIFTALITTMQPLPGSGSPQVAIFTNTKNSALLFLNNYQALAE
jgi:hypothetical protein